MRPYAAVILFTSIALVTFLSLLGRPARDRRAALFVGAGLLAALCQPTSLGVIGCLMHGPLVRGRQFKQLLKCRDRPLAQKALGQPNLPGWIARDPARG